MSQKSRLTVEILVRMPLPAGAKVDRALGYVREALRSWAGGIDPQDPMASLAGEQLIVKLVRKETVYL